MFIAPSIISCFVKTSLLMESCLLFSAQSFFHQVVNIVIVFGVNYFPDNHEMPALVKSY